MREGGWICLEVKAIAIKVVSICVEKYVFTPLVLLSSEVCLGHCQFP